MYSCTPKRKALKIHHFHQKVGNEMLPLVMLSQELDFLFMPPQSENIYKLKRNGQHRKAPGPLFRLGIQRTPHKGSEKDPSLLPAPLSIPLLELAGTIFRQHF